MFGFSRSMALAHGCTRALMIAASLVLAATTRFAAVTTMTTEGHCSEADFAKMEEAGDGTSSTSVRGLRADYGENQLSELANECCAITWVELNGGCRAATRASWPTSVAPLHGSS